MQSLTAPPREHLSAAAVRALITGPAVHVTAGLELLDGGVWSDISDVLVAAGSSIRWDNRAAVQASATLVVQRELAWGRDRLRPYVVLADHPTRPRTRARFDLGVYLPSQPDEARGETPATWDVTCYSLLDVLRAAGPADTWVAVVGTTYYDALAAIVAASGVGAPLRLPTALQDVVLPATRVWCPLSPVPSWLRMMQDLCAEVGYVGPYLDPDGAITARPHVPLADRAVEWTLDTRDRATGLVHPGRTVSIDSDDVPNRWVFVRSDMEGTPVLDDGIYVVDNLTSGPASQEQLGRVIPSWVPLTAESHESLVAQADRIVADDMAAATTYALTVEPLPIMGMLDCVQLVDVTAAGLVETVKVVAASWELHLDGSAGSLQLGGTPAEPLEPVEASARATVTNDAPLSVLVDGATVPCFANGLDGATYELGDRVTIQIRNPLPPLVQGIET